MEKSNPLPQPQESNEHKSYEKRQDENHSLESGSHTKSFYGHPKQWWHEALNGLRMKNKMGAGSYGWLINSLA